jgi:hypothetical protein
MAIEHRVNDPSMSHSEAEDTTYVQSLKFQY